MIAFINPVVLLSGYQLHNALELSIFSIGVENYSFINFFHTCNTYNNVYM